MRLIDADSIPWDVEGVGEIPVITKEEIEAMPVVEAIPIEWIEKYLRNYRYMAPIEKCFAREMIKAWAERKEE